MTVGEINRASDKFLAFVQASLEPLGKWFVLESSAGREMPMPPDGLYVEDLTGWLVPLERAGATRDQMTEHDPWGFIEWDAPAGGELTVRWRPGSDFD